MRYVMFMIPAAYNGAALVDGMPSAEMVQAMMEYNTELDEAGVLLALDGLHPPGEGARFTFSAQGPHQTEISGPGVVGGYWVLEVADHDEAVRWARSVPALPGDVIEVRRIQEAEDFPDDVQDVLKEYDL